MQNEAIVTTVLLEAMRYKTNAKGRKGPYFRMLVCAFCGVYITFRDFYKLVAVKTSNALQENAEYKKIFKGTDTEDLEWRMAGDYRDVADDANNHIMDYDTNKILCRQCNNIIGEFNRDNYYYIRVMEVTFLQNLKTN